MKHLFLSVAMIMGFALNSFGQNQHPAEPEMVLVNGGTFLMGCSTEQGRDCNEDELPLHSVTVGSFYIGKYPITQKQWQLLMGDAVEKPHGQGNENSPVYGEGGEYHPYGYGEGDDFPRYYVSWEEAQEFIRRLNGATGKNYRLPTEAEWEFAARGGDKSKGYKYSGSDNLSDVAWFGENSGDKTHSVGTKAPNELEIFDMSGNVWEWCCDWYGVYSDSAQTDPAGSSSGSARVFRGGSWGCDAKSCRVSHRDDGTPTPRCGDLGLRVVLPQ